jgi:hypothetical protein
MKIICIFVKQFHHKNINALRLYKNIDVLYVEDINQLYYLPLKEFDALFSPCYPIDVSLFPDIKHFIFGPHLTIFPEYHIIKPILSNRTDTTVSYLLLSKWVKEFWQTYPICKNLSLHDFPFGVDTTRFCDNGGNVPNVPNSLKGEVFVYFKRRNPTELYMVLQFLQRHNIPFKVFDYVKTYSEDDYIKCLQNAKYGIWIDAHESQGFALQEALSCNVPLLVWNIKSMKDEYGSSYDDLFATTIPYWDERCGEVFYKSDDFITTFNRFLSGIDCNQYKPREFVLETLSIDVCEKHFMNLVTNNNNATK